MPRAATGIEMSTSEALSRGAIPALWIAWILYWIVAARNVKRTRWRESVAQNLLHGIPLALCFILLVLPRRLPRLLTERLVPLGPVSAVVGTVLVAAGLGFAVWARLYLGRNWSGRVEVKIDHALVRTGPYRFVRHPIYSGMLLALVGTALAIAEWRGVLAFIFALIGVLFRVRAEETQMRRLFPEYAQYQRDTGALVPIVF